MEDVTFVFLPENVSAVSSHPSDSNKIDVDVFHFPFFFLKKKKKKKKKTSRDRIWPMYSREKYSFF